MPQQKQKHWIERLLRSRYFLYALLFHLVLFILTSSSVIFKGFKRNDNFDSTTLVAGDRDEVAPPPPPPATQPTETQTPQVQIAPAAAPTDLIATDIPSPDSFSVQTSAMVAPHVDANVATQQVANAAPPTSDNSQQRFQDIQQFTDKWGVGGKGGVRGHGATTEAEFVCYAAQYSDGDWYAAVSRDNDGNIVGGSLMNLTHFINERSKGRIKASVVPRALNLSSNEIFEKNPPFIFFNGHKDFTLTQAEVENLRKYVMRGGAIWGDNGLAGAGSRFDIAFHREMKRVIPDVDKPFENVSNDHPIYTDSFYPMEGPPPGMNYYQEPLEMIRIDKEIAVIYTPNNYVDLMRMAFQPNSNNPIVIRVFWQKYKDGWYNTPAWMWDNSDTFFRGFKPENCEQADHLAVNIIIHLLTRFQERLRFGM